MGPQLCGRHSAPASTTIHALGRGSAGEERAEDALTGDPEAQVSAPPAKGGGTARVAIAVIVVVAIVVLAAIGAAAFAFTSAANDHKATVAVLEGVRVHNNDISVQLKQTPSFSQASLTG